jgi:hypothetical protein
MDHKDDGGYYATNGVSGDFDDDEFSDDSDDSLDLENEDITSGDNVSSTNQKVSDFIRGDDRMTDNIMSKFEYARVVGALAKMYDANFPLHLDVKAAAEDLEYYDPLDIAVLHLSMRDIPCPIDILRPMPSGKFEEWNPSEMVFPSEMYDHKFVGSINEEQEL